jgi:hypothetical protein
MSETKRPWHGTDNPFEALHDWMVKEMTALEARVKPAPAPVVEDESATNASEPIGSFAPVPYKGESVPVSSSFPSAPSVVEPMPIPPSSSQEF